MFGDQHRGRTAKHLVRERKLRYQFFGSTLFDEHAWDMLLHLFTALTENETVSEADLIRRAGVDTPVGRRWLAHLVADGQVQTREDGADVLLTDDATRRMRDYLDRVEQALSSRDEHDRPLP